MNAGPTGTTTVAPDHPDRVDSRTAMRQLLADWAARGWLRALDAAFADFLWRECPAADRWLILAAALTSHQLGRGHACLDLPATLADPAFALSLPPEGDSPSDALAPVPSPAQVLSGLTLARWLAALDFPSLVGTGPGNTPLVRGGERLYLRRYWQYEQDVRAGIELRLRAPAALDDALPVAPLRQIVAALFPSPTPPGPAANWQKLACALAARRSFSIITGGPGTGKTTTVVRLLALLQALALLPESPSGSPGRALRIRLAAPTGKAAARLNESIAKALAGLPLAGIAQGEAVRAAIPEQVTTLHRLLGSRPDTRHFRHHAGNPLALDVLVIDEASMVDLEMMAAVLAALPRTARLVLLGDQDQLASVEAGAVLGQLCQRARQGHYNAATAHWLETVAGEAIDPALLDEAGTPLDQAVVMLRHSYRFGAASGIGRLAEAVNAGDPGAVREIWRSDHADLTRLRVTLHDDTALRDLVIDGYGPYLDVVRQSRPPLDADAQRFDAWATSVLAAHGRFQVLCALRRGPWGVAGLNRRMALWLREAGLIAQSEGWYPGRPVLVTRNDYSLGLMNGDIGIALAQPALTEHGWRLRVAFAAGGNGAGVKWVLPSRLQDVETVYALTVHKAQGSEFDHAALVLPDTLNPVLTRELIYTGITRAVKRLTLAQAGAARVLEQAIARRVLRPSGLMDGNDVTVA